MKLFLEEKLRATRSDPSAKLRMIGVRERMHVADLGAGKGLYAVVSAGIVGTEGVVYAVEPDKSRAATIERRIASEKLGNVKVIATGAESLSEVPDSTIDIAFSLNSMHHFGDREAVFAEVHRVLKGGGKFYVRDIVRNWLTWHGTRKEDVALLPASRFSDRRVRVTSFTLEATYTK